MGQSGEFSQRLRGFGRLAKALEKSRKMRDRLIGRGGVGRSGLAAANNSSALCWPQPPHQDPAIKIPSSILDHFTFNHARTGMSSIGFGGLRFAVTLFIACLTVTTVFVGFSRLLVSIAAIVGCVKTRPLEQQPPPMPMSRLTGPVQFASGQVWRGAAVML